MIALIDGDIVVHRAGYASDNDPEDIALLRTDDMIDHILMETGCNECEVWLSDDYTNNFRKHLEPLYKANRVQARPVHYEAIKNHLYAFWQARLALGMEADDALGIRQTQLGMSNDQIGEGLAWKNPNSIICSIDKDLLQIPGQHYNFVRKEFHSVELNTGLRWFYKQLLIGDTSDNIKGVEKIGPVKAGKLLDHIIDEKEMFNVVRQLYNDDERLLLNGRLLWIRRKDEELWEFPK